MAEERINRYEGLFLLTQAAGANFPAAIEHIRGFLDRAKAEVDALYKWDERRLAYPIKGQKRGTYIIAYFRAPAPAMVGLERDCNLSEQVLRSMFTRADHMGDVEMELVRKDAGVKAAEEKLREEGGEEAVEAARAAQAAEAEAQAQAEAEAEAEAKAETAGSEKEKSEEQGKEETEDQAEAETAKA